jgi:GNAT superfamily N-acetyltransferase
VTTVLPVLGDDPRLVGLAIAQQQEVALRYAENPEHGFAQPPLSPATIWLLLLGDDGTALGCVAVQPVAHTLPGAAADVGEIKRLYVDPVARGRGLSRALMTEAEQVAGHAGYRALQLETGLRQPEAVALYRNLGYEQIDPYGHYRDSPESVCFRKTLPPATAGSDQPARPS